MDDSFEREFKTVNGFHVFKAASFPGKKYLAGKKDGNRLGKRKRNLIVDISCVRKGEMLQILNKVFLHPDDYKIFQEYNNFKQEIDDVIQKHKMGGN